MPACWAHGIRLARSHLPVESHLTQLLLHSEAVFFCFLRWHRWLLLRIKVPHLELNLLDALAHSQISGPCLFRCPEVRGVLRFSLLWLIHLRCILAELAFLWLSRFSNVTFMITLNTWSPACPYTGCLNIVELFITILACICSVSKSLPPQPL